MIEIACVSRSRLVAITECGQSLPITNFFDADGEECASDGAVVCVAGPDKDGMWLTIDFREMEMVAMQ